MIRSEYELRPECRDLPADRSDRVWPEDSILLPFSAISRTKAGRQVRRYKSALARPSPEPKPNASEYTIETFHAEFSQAGWVGWAALGPTAFGRDLELRRASTRNILQIRQPPCNSSRSRPGAGGVGRDGDGQTRG